MPSPLPCRFQRVWYALLFQSDAEADYILDEVVFDEMSKMLNKAGFVLLSVTENGWHGMGTQGTPILKASDFKGRKLRVSKAGCI